MLIELLNITKSYPTPAGEDRLVLDGLDLAVEEGQSLAVVGPSGSGKSTLLNIMGALDRPTSGTVLFDGEELSQKDEKQLAEVRARRIGFVFQQHYLLPQLTVLENVLVPTIPLRNEGDKTERAKELLKRVGLKDHLDYRPGFLSGGEQQRVAVVRALINEPRLLLADEPTGSLDWASAENLADLLLQLNKENGIALVVVTHSTEIAQKMASVHQLKAGRLQSR